MDSFQKNFLIVTLLLFFQGCASRHNGEVGSMTDGFADINSLDPSIVIEVRYGTNNNFVGRPIEGYDAAKIIMSTEAALAIVRVQKDLQHGGLALKIFDAYRPQQAVDHFVRWAADLEDEAMKQQYYPNIEKSNLFRDGYIAERSGHTRGSTVDLTLIELDSGEELDMGSPWDFFDPVSWPTSDLVSAEQKGNRNLLRDAMGKQGFRPLAEEWWHFTLEMEPYPDTYFEFPIR